MDAWAIYVIIIASIILVKVVIVTFFILRSKRQKRKREAMRQAQLRAYAQASMEQQSRAMEGQSRTSLDPWVQPELYSAVVIMEDDHPPTYDEVTADRMTSIKERTEERY